MKGMSILIAFMLLLLITVSIIGFAYLFFARPPDKTVETKYTSGIWIENAIGNQIFIRNSENKGVKTADINIYINNIPKLCEWNSETILSSNTATCTLEESCSGKIVKAAGPSNENSKSCV